MLSLVLVSLSGARTRAQTHFGAARVDITPESPIRLSGYGSRTEPSQGVDERLFARALVMGYVSDGKSRVTHVLVSLESIGVPGDFSTEVYRELRTRYGIERSGFVLCSTHSHTAPHIAGGLKNLFGGPIKQREREVLEEYRKQVEKAVVEAVEKAVGELEPGHLELAQGSATFARHRRVIKDGAWTGFGENANGPVDHSLPVLRVVSENRSVTLAVVFNYACHCTTFGGDYNRVNGDWAGYASKYIEETQGGAVALCTIGCGADANPARDSARALEIAQSQGREIADEVNRLAEAGSWAGVPTAGSDSGSANGATQFGFAGLPIERPTDEALEAALADGRYQVRRHAEEMLATKKRMGRIPESYPMPIQVWNFGAFEDGGVENGQAGLSMVFLGGEVCVEYAQRIKEELVRKASEGKYPLADLNPGQVWVSAYANDVFGYVAPERMRSEGGYEVDYSMVYYLQPGRWASGTEDIIIERVHELAQAAVRSDGRDLSGIQLSDESLEAVLIASEPVVRDPINLAVGSGGELWVVEMGDYPSGNPDEIEPGEVFRNQRAYRGTEERPWNDSPGGRVKRLHDRDGDGVYEEATVFLDGLKFPTGVFPWQKGLIVCAAPDILYAEDRDGDGRCDFTKVLFTGFSEANPQHRVNGFEWGLDGWLYLAAGNHDNGLVKSLITGEEVETSGRDLRINPTTGHIETLSGASQWIRTRDGAGNWYGNDNTRPIYQYVIEDRFVARNPYVPSPSPRAYLTEPPRSPEVYPVSRTEGRFNDLHTRNRFTSACGPMVYRSGSGQLEALICEPVHNLVSRIQLDDAGIVFHGQRLATESQSEFLASKENWFRPVRIVQAPNSDLFWLCDMHRQVIEHPEWIPESWQKSLDLYAGSAMGRLYAVRKKNGGNRLAIPDLASESSEQLVDRLRSDNRWVRDTAHRLILERSRTGETLAGVSDSLVRLSLDDELNSESRIQAMWLLTAIEPAKLPTSELAANSKSKAQILVALARLSEIPEVDLRSDPLQVMLEHSHGQVRFEAALAVGWLDVEEQDAMVSSLVELAIRERNEPLVNAAILSSTRFLAPRMLEAILGQQQFTDVAPELLEGLIATALGGRKSDVVESLLVSLLQDHNGGDLKVFENGTRIRSVLFLLDKLERLQVDIRALLFSAEPNTPVARLKQAAERWEVGIQAGDDAMSAEQLRLVAYLARDSKATGKAMVKLLQPKTALETQLAVVEALFQMNAIEELVTRIPMLTPAIRARVESLLLTRVEATSVLVNALESGLLQMSDLSASGRQVLLEHPRSSIREAFEKLLRSGKPKTDRLALVARYQSEMPQAEGIERGKAVFEKHCAACHRLNGIGQDVGPDLKSLVGKDKDYLLTAILDPNQAVESKYRSYRVLTNDDRMLVGMVLRESATSIRLARSDGTQVDVLRNEIAEMKTSTLSPMPEGFEESIDTSAMSALLKYVQASR
ncbi:MAG: neutral/alkaline non-lysosomal ceramidase N-terminal domain-containing protein [Aureliella sp.]